MKCALPRGRLGQASEFFVRSQRRCASAFAITSLILTGRECAPNNLDGLSQWFQPEFEVVGVRRIGDLDPEKTEFPKRALVDARDTIGDVLLRQKG